FALLVFAIHPLQVETVAWLGATNNLLFVFFLFSGLYSYLLVVQNKQNEFYFFSLLLFLLACLSKSSAVIFPLLLLLVDFYLKGKLTLKDVLLKLPFFALSILFGLISIKAAQHFGSVEPVLNVYSWYNIPVVVAQQMAFYIIKLFVPIGLKIRYNNPQEINGILPVWSYFSIVVLAVLSWAGFYFRKNKTWWFGLLWFLIGVVLVLKIRYST